MVQRRVPGWWEVAELQGESTQTSGVPHPWFTEGTDRRYPAPWFSKGFIRASDS